MRIIRARALAIVCSMLLPTFAFAQQSGTSTKQERVTPPRGTWAVGADLGFSNPIGDEDFDAEPLIKGYGEYFFTSHVSLRGTLGWISFDGPDLSDPPFPSTNVDILMLLADVGYQWEGGKVHPFVLGGIGFYDYDHDFGGGDLELGANFGGGANFYITPRFAIKLEGMLHGTSATEPDSFFNVSVGARWLL